MSELNKLVGKLLTAFAGLLVSVNKICAHLTFVKALNFHFFKREHFSCLSLHSYCLNVMLSVICSFFESNSSYFFMQIYF